MDDTPNNQPSQESTPETPPHNASSQPNEQAKPPEKQPNERLLKAQAYMAMTYGQKAASAEADRKALYPTLSAPSLLSPGMESECVDCGDIGWTRVPQGEAPGEKGFGELQRCHCVAKRAATRRMSYLVGEELVQAYTFSSFQPVNGAPAVHNAIMAEAKVAAVAWANGSGPPFLVVIGAPGCGKSHLALSGIRAAAESGMGTSYWMFREYLNVEQASFGVDAMKDEAERARNEITLAQVLAIDDYGVERGSDWTSEQMEGIVGFRYQRRGQLRTFITSNTLANLPERVASRFSDPTACKIVDCKGAIDVRPLMQRVAA